MPPKLPLGMKKTARIPVLCSPIQKRAIEVRAKALGLSTSDHLLRLAMNDAQQNGVDSTPEMA